MSNIVEFYMNTFVPFYESSVGNEVDISVLIGASHDWSPFVLRTANKEQFEKDLATAVIVNFCKTYGDTTSFNKLGLNELTSILRKTSTESNAQRTLLLHLTKMRNSVPTAAFYFNQTNWMKIIRVPLQDEVEWKRLARKVIQHEQIQNCIKDSIREFELAIPDDMEIEKVAITLVDNVTTNVRGFSGFEEVFINAHHFRNKFDSFVGEKNLLQLLAKMDIISVAIHEMSHVLIRKCAKNFNMSTPNMAQLKGLPPDRYAFGRYNEIRIFGTQVDWISSIHADVGYIERFISAIENNHLLPDGFVYGVVDRVQSPGVGLDLQIPSYLC